jgi:hypothetical protein
VFDSNYDLKKRNRLAISSSLFQRLKRTLEMNLNFEYLGVFELIFENKGKNQTRLVFCWKKIDFYCTASFCAMAQSA